MSFPKIIVLLLVILSACAPSTPTVTPVPVTATVVVVTDTATPTGDAAFLPNPMLTPGALNSYVTQDTIDTTICVPGYSSLIRPPVSYTDNLKIKQIAQYEYTDTNTADYEEDHFIPLSVGGNPTDTRNLWPQPRYTSPYNAGVKDKLEYVLYRNVCAGMISLADAQKVIVADWVEAYRKYVSPNLGISFTPEP